MNGKKFFFQYKDALEIMTKPDGFNESNVPLYKNSIYTKLLDEVPKDIIGNRDIFSSDFESLIETWSDYRQRNKKKMSNVPTSTTKWNKTMTTLLEMKH